ncbi:MAG: hypothetical protein LBP35_05015 [Candidatus Ancillula trichonymphae]|jgi:Na+/proline symporter|nr:hypothetical protein [Candidatus Ancillula trichonymphae]
MIAGLIVFYTLTKSTLGTIDHRPPSPILPAERKRIFTFCAGLAVVIAVLAAVLSAANALTLEGSSIITPVTCTSYCGILVCDDVGG